MRTRKSLTLTLLAAGAAALLGTACGDDGGSNGPVDAKVDAKPPADAAPDAPPPAVRAGTIGVFDVKVTTPGTGVDNPGADVLGVRGGIVSVSFTDPKEVSGELIFGKDQPGVGECSVVKFTKGTNKPRTPLDEGKITISGPGLLKPVGDCALNATTKAYECPFKSGTADVEIKALDPAKGTYTVKLTGDFGTTDYVASYLRLSGLAEAGFNNTFPVLQKVVQDGANSMTVLTSIPKELTTAPMEIKTGITYSFLGGFGPIPTTPTTANADFLSDNKTSDPTPAPEPVTVKKAASTALKEKMVALQPQGEGFDLTDRKAHEFPFTKGTDATFNCGTKCGSPSSDTVIVMILSGITTDVTIPDDKPKFFMPPVEAATSYVTFQCAALLDLASPQGITLPKDAVDKILDTNPTRIETRVFAASGSPEADGMSRINFLVGHGVIGHTSKP